MDINVLQIENQIPTHTFGSRLTLSIAYIEMDLKENLRHSKLR